MPFISAQKPGFQVLVHLVICFYKLYSISLIFTKAPAQSHGSSGIGADGTPCFTHCPSLQIQSSSDPPTTKRRNKTATTITANVSKSFFKIGIILFIYQLAIRGVQTLSIIILYILKTIFYQNHPVMSSSFP